MTTLRTRWEEVALSATEATEAVDAQSVDDALTLLAAQGEIFISAGIAYLDPSFVAGLMKPLVDHRLSSRACALGIAQSAAHGSALVAALDELTTAGVLREELLAMLWRDTDLSSADYAAVLQLLEETGILFPITAAADMAEGDGSRWVLPMRLPTQPPSAIPGTWNQRLFCAQQGEVAHAESLALGSFVPPGLLERLMAACYALGQHRYFWRRPHGAGALIKVALGESGQDGGDSGVQARLLFDVDEVSADTEAGDTAISVTQAKYALRFEVFAPPAYISEAARLLAKAQALLDRLLLDFPGMITSALRGPAQWRRVEPCPRVSAYC